MVRLELDGSNNSVLDVARSLADHFQSKVVGIAACQPAMELYDEGFAANRIAAEEREEILAALERAQRQFRTAFRSYANKIEWRSKVTFEPLENYIADESRGADLIISNPAPTDIIRTSSRRVDIGRLVLKAGRPVLVVPKTLSSFVARHAVVGWKNSREARRAVADALPLLKLADKSTVLQVTTERQKDDARTSIKDVALWLKTHGISAETNAVTSDGMEEGQIHSELLNRKCDIFVAGAYGHSRVRESVFGGVTRDILVSPDFCVLISN